MKILLIVILLLFVWIAFEMWRAPMMEETEDGGLRTIRPAKKLSDLFKRNKT